MVICLAVLVFTANLGSCVSQVLAASGHLDPAFSGDGKVLHEVRTGLSEPWAVSVDASGRVVVAGRASNGVTIDFAVARYLDNGGLDPSFGTNGIVLRDLPEPGPNYGYALALDPSQRMLVAGFSSNSDGLDFCVARLSSDGTLDETFNGSGVAIADFGDFIEKAFAVAVDPSGKVVVAGLTGNEFLDVPYDFALARFNDDGSLDETFGGDGRVVTPGGFTYASEGLFDLVIDEVGRVLVTAGYPHPLAVRYAADGTLDATFAQDGILELGDLFAVTWQIAIDEGNRILVLGSAGSSDSVARLNSDGSLDETFGVGGFTTPGFSGVAASMALDPSGRILLGGTAPGTAFGVVRYHANGMLDRSFGSEGLAVATVSGTDLGHAVAVDESGRILLAGPANGDWAVVRFQGDTCGDGLLDPSNEECDDGDTGGVDCCSETCEFQASGVACPDRNLCNRGETCDGAGTCRLGVAIDCDDGDPCTQDSCDPTAGCLNPAGPATTCLDVWEKGSLKMDERRPGREALTVKLRKGPGLDAADFGDPLSPNGTAYTACIYDDAEALVGRMEVDRGGANCGARPCWKRTPSGYSYKDVTASADGVSQIKLKGGKAGRSQVVLKGANSIARGEIDLPVGIAGGLSTSSNATVQVHGSDAPACFSVVLDEIEGQQPDLFEASRVLGESAP